MPVKIHGKEYLTVAERVQTFREKHPDWIISTEIITFEGDDCIVKATIANAEGNLKAVGHAHEVKGSTNINKTSHVENAETSAIGRCLAAFGFSGSEYASADEVVNAINNQAVQEATDRLTTHMDAVKRNFDAVGHIKEGIQNDDLGLAVGAYYDLSEGDMVALALAPTKGGIWTVEEYAKFKSNEWSKAKNQHFGVG